MRPEAGASSSASGVRSPMAMASPGRSLIAHQRDRHIRHRHLPGPTIWSRAVMPPTVRSPMVIRKVLFGHRRQTQHALERPRAGRCRSMSTGGQLRGLARCTSRVIFGGLPSSTAIGMSTGLIAEMRVVHGQLAVAGRRRRPPQTGSARARTSPGTLPAAPARSPAHSAPAPRCTRSRFGDMPGSSFGILRSSKRAPRPPPCTSSGNALDMPPAPTSWIDRIGIARRPSASSGR